VEVWGGFRRGRATDGRQARLRGPDLG
jgi:hypothetical protein